MIASGASGGPSSGRGDVQSLSHLERLGEGAESKLHVIALRTRGHAYVRSECSAEGFAEALSGLDLVRMWRRVNAPCRDCALRPPGGGARARLGLSYRPTVGGRVACESPASIVIGRHEQRPAVTLG